MGFAVLYPSYRLRILPSRCYIMIWLLKDRAMDGKRTFAVVLEPEEEGGFTVRVPAFPEIVTYGKDEREALAMAEDAIRLVIADGAVSDRA
jgi:predicted RNase H-like HicB family nuclease